jgi:formate dehydrogenase subunit gamma
LPRSTQLPGVEQASVAVDQRRLKKHDVAIILLHWFNAATWGLELATGAALVTSPYFRVAPRWYVSLLEGILGGRPNLLGFHVALGLLWIFVFLVYATFGFRSYLHHEVLQKEIALDRDDWRWLVVRTLGILGRSKEKLPPQGIYNAGQKLFALMVYAMIPVVMLSGLVMTFRWFSPAAVGWAASCTSWPSASSSRACWCTSTWARSYPRRGRPSSR